MRMRVTPSSTISSVTDLDLKDPASPLAKPTTAGAFNAPVSPVDIEADGLTKHFGDAPIFSNVSFRLARGEAVAIVGANGTGKSTLLRCAMGLIPVTSGAVTLLGQNMVRASTAE